MLKQILLVPTVIKVTMIWMVSTWIDVIITKLALLELIVAVEIFSTLLMITWEMPQHLKDLRNLIYNAVKCLNCCEILVSKHVHDFKKCSCENETMVDGGLEYERFGGKDLNLVKSLGVYSDEPHEIVREFLERGGRGISGDEPLTYTTLKNINDSWLEAIVKYEEEFRPKNKYLIHFKNEMEWRRKNLDLT